MKRAKTYQPSVMKLESRWLPTVGPYADPIRNAFQASYVAEASVVKNPVVFFGDSITYNWGSATRQAPGSTVFSENFAGLGVSNFGIPGDTTQNLLDRIAGGDFNGKPKLAVLMVGVNDLYWGASPQQAADGVASVIQSIQTVSPRTQILLLGVLPTDQARLNPEIQVLNGLIAPLGSKAGVTYLNPGQLFLDSGIAARPGLLIDGVHPTDAGYQVIAGVIDSTVLKLLAPADSTTVSSVTQKPTVATLKTKVVASVVVDSSNELDLEFIPPTTLTSATSIVDPVTFSRKSFATELINVRSV